jgi:hypothetical protein
MQLFCPECKSAFTGLTRCPRCKGLLLLPEESATEADTPAQELPELHRPTPSGRIFAGTVLALVLYLAFRKLSMGAVMAFGMEPEEWWQTPGGTLAILSIQAVAAIFGALLAGAGRNLSFAIGLAVGGLCGALFFAAEFFGDARTGQPMPYLQPLVLAVGAGIAGLIGSRIWPPVPELELPKPADPELEALQLETALAAKKQPRTAWFRVALGSGIIVAGAALANPLRVEAQKATGGALHAESRWEARFVSCQFAALIIMGGGIVAGAATGAGIRHGVYAGLLGSIGVFALAGSYGDLATPGGYVGDELNIGSSDPTNVFALGTMVIGVFAGGLIGGWLGGTLFLPLAPRHLRHRLLRIGDD